MVKHKDPLVGTALDGRYEILERVGSGGMGTVYKARQIFMDEIVALKIVRPELQQNEVFRGRFFREVKNASRIKHHNAIQIFDSGELADGTLYIAMEYISGGNLKTLLQHHPKGLPISLALQVACQIGNALAAVHANGIIHRDLKPDNILLHKFSSSSMAVKVADFGVSRALNSGHLTQTGLVVGTPTYMSPEQGLGRELDIRSDIYSLGVIIYAMLAGGPPFASDTPLGYVAMHNLESPPPLLGKREDISEALQDIVLTALEKHPSKRYQSVEALTAALERRIIEEQLSEAESLLPVQATVDAFAADKASWADILLAENIEFEDLPDTVAVDEAPLVSTIVGVRVNRRLLVRLSTYLLGVFMLISIVNNIFLTTDAEQSHAIAAEKKNFEQPVSVVAVDPAPAPKKQMKKERKRTSPRPAFVSQQKQPAPPVTRKKKEAAVAKPVVSTEEFADTLTVVSNRHRANSSTPSIQNDEVQRFVDEYLGFGNNADVNGIVTLYDPWVDFLDLGLVGIEEIERECREQNQNWPENYLRLNDDILIRTLSKDGSRKEITLRLGFTRFNREKGVGFAGESEYMMVIQKRAGQLKITRETRKHLHNEQFYDSTAISAADQAG